MPTNPPAPEKAPPGIVTEGSVEIGDWILFEDWLGRVKWQHIQSESDVASGPRMLAVLRPPQPDPSEREWELIAQWRTKARQMSEGVMYSGSPIQMLKHCADQLEAALEREGEEPK